MKEDRKGRPERSKSEPRGAGHRELTEHDRVVHEIAIHQIELEAQNEMLRDAQVILEESRAAYASLYDYAPVGHITLDAFGNIRQLNFTCAMLLGRERRLLEGSALRLLLDQSSRRALDAHLRASLASREAMTVELTVLVNDFPRPVELVTAPSLHLGDQMGRDVICHSAMIDISRRRRDDERREELLRREHEARLLAESANQVKEDFLAVVSHELRTPLAPMLLWLRTLQAGRASESARARAIAAIEASVRVQVAMIDDLVDVARGRHGKLHVERRLMDLRPVVVAAVDTVAPSAAAKVIQVNLELTSERACVSGDAIRLQQVTQNLLTNSIKFTPEGGRVTVSLSMTSEDVVLVVSDDGEGIDTKLLESVFEPFRQSERTQVRPQGGLGLGLAIVRQLVAEHDGHVRGESAGRGKGASFTVRLPRLDGTTLPIEEAAIGARPVAQRNDADGLAGLSVVIVEDQGDIREALAGILRTAGAEVIAAASLDDGLRAIRATNPDVLVSDISLPGKDGYTLVRRLRQWETETRSRRLPAIALTAHAGAPDRARALLAGFDRHIATPIAFDELIAMISAIAPRPKD